MATKGPLWAGWRHFAGELRLMLASPEGKNGFVETEFLPLLRM